MLRRPPSLTLFPYTDALPISEAVNGEEEEFGENRLVAASLRGRQLSAEALHRFLLDLVTEEAVQRRSEEHTSELQSHSDLVCRLLLEKKKLEGEGSQCIYGSW